MSDNGATKWEDLTAEEKLLRSIFQIKQELPYYAIVYSCMDRVLSDITNTMGVDESTMYYNPDFVNSISLEELNFINLHEICHIAFKHVTHGKHKNHVLHNLAADLIINKFLVNELCHKTHKHRDEVIRGEKFSLHNKDIILPEHCLYCSTIDLETDTVDHIYNELYKQAEQNGYLSDINKINVASDEIVFKEYTFTYRGSLNVNNVDSVFKYKIPVGYVGDLMASKLSKEESDQASNNILRRIKVKQELDKSSYGDSPCDLEREVEKFLKSEFDWKRYVQSYCCKLTSSDTSFVRPDKRMSYQKAIYPGSSLDESNYLKGIKICIDTSGSISEIDLSRFLGQLDALLSKYKVDAEIIYWDYVVEGHGDFSKREELKKAKPIGGGGTDVGCVFNYLDSKKCKVKPVLTIIFTDGFFGDDFDNPKNARKFKDTLWIMTEDHNRGFKPSFGKVAVPKFKE